MSTVRTRLLSAAAVLLTGTALAVGVPAALADGSPPSPAITVTPSAGLNPDGDTVTASGTGFTTASGTFGVYVALAARDHFSPTNSAAFSATKWVHLGAPSTSSQDALNADGSFSTTLSVQAVFGSGDNATDCRVTQCAIFTLAAHGSPDRSQDTSVDVSFGPSITVTPSTDLDPAGQTVTVSGVGYRAGSGVYVAETVARPDSGYPSSYGNAVWLKNIGTDGTLSTPLTLTPTFTPRGGDPIDCRQVQCYVATFNDHTDIDNRDQDVWRPISFAAAQTTEPAPETSTTSNPPSSSSAPSPTTSAPSGAPAVTVSPATGLDPAGSTVTISGTGFKTTGTGIYVGIAARSLYSPTNADAFGAVTWLGIPGAAGAPEHLNADGSFSTTLSLAAVFGAGADATDCTRTQCAVFTLAAHGVSDRSQDTATDVVFGSTPPPSQDTSTAPASPAASTTPTASGTLADSTLAPGESTVVTASGFDPGEQIQAVLHSTPLDLGISPADGNGAYRLEFTVPADFEPGAHTLVLTGLSSQRVVTVPLTITPAGVAGVSTSAGAGADASPAADGTVLASTGTNTAGLLGFALALLIGGGALSVVLRRPRRARLH